MAREPLDKIERIRSSLMALVRGAQHSHNKILEKNLLYIVSVCDEKAAQQPTASEPPALFKTRAIIGELRDSLGLEHGSEREARLWAVLVWLEQSYGEKGIHLRIPVSTSHANERKEPLAPAELLSPPSQTGAPSEQEMGGARATAEAIAAKYFGTKGDLRRQLTAEIVAALQSGDNRAGLHRQMERIADGLRKMRDGDRSGMSAQHMLEIAEQALAGQTSDGEPKT